MAVVDKTLNSMLRPKTLEKIVLLDRIRKEVSGGLTQNFILFSSSPGTGKTSLSKILATGYPTMHINCRTDANVELVRNQLNEFCSTRSLLHDEAEYKVICLDEMDGATAAFFDAMKPFVEKFEDTVRFIGTCNYINKIPEPVLDRFRVIHFYPLDSDEETELYKKYEKRINAISKKLGLVWESEEVLTEFIKKDFPSLRRLFSKLQALSVMGLEVITIEDVKRSSFAFEEIFKMMVGKPDSMNNFKIIMAEYVTKINEVFSSISQEFPDWLEENRPELLIKLPQILITAAKYEFQARGSIDPVLQLLACVFEVQNYLKG